MVKYGKIKVDNQCKICGLKFKEKGSIGSHLRIHKIKYNDYIVKYYLKNNLPECYNKNCHKKVNFINQRLKKFCSGKCQNDLENNPNWKGGKYRDNGYVYIKNKPHPNKNNFGYIGEHILIMEKHIGRFLKKGEVVHHKNNIRNDNKIENLDLINSSEHMKIHRKKFKYCRLQTPLSLRNSRAVRFVFKKWETKI